MITTAQLQALSRPQLDAVFAALGGSVTLGSSTAPGIVVTTDPPPGAKVGERSHAPTHVAYLRWDAITGNRTPYPVIYQGVIFVPLAQAEDIGRQGVCWEMPLVELLQFYDSTATVDGQNIRLRIEAQTATAARVTSGNDLATVPLSSHRGYLPPGVHLDVGQSVVTTGGQAFEVVQPIQRSPIGDSVGLSWSGGGTVY